MVYDRPEVIATCPKFFHVRKDKSDGHGTEISSKRQFFAQHFDRLHWMVELHGIIPK